MTNNLKVDIITIENISDTGRNNYGVKTTINYPDRVVELDNMYRIHEVVHKSYVKRDMRISEFNYYDYNSHKIVKSLKLYYNSPRLSMPDIVINNYIYNDDGSYRIEVLDSFTNNLNEVNWFFLSSIEYYNSDGIMIGSSQNIKEKNKIYDHGMDSFISDDIRLNIFDRINFNLINKINLIKFDREETYIDSKGNTIIECRRDDRKHIAIKKINKHGEVIYAEVDSDCDWMRYDSYGRMIYKKKRLKRFLLKPHMFEAQYFYDMNGNKSGIIINDKTEVIYKEMKSYDNNNLCIYSYVYKKDNVFKKDNDEYHIYNSYDSHNRIICSYSPDRPELSETYKYFNPKE